MSEPKVRLGMVSWKFDNLRFTRHLTISEMTSVDPPKESNKITTWRGEIKVSAEVLGILAPENSVDRVVYEILKRKFES